MIQQRTNKPTCILRSCILHKCQGDEHQCLSKDNWHHIGGKQLEWDVLTCTTNLTITYKTFCVLYGNLTNSLYQNDRCANNCIENDNLYKEHHKSTTGNSGKTRAYFLDESLRQTCDDTNHND